MAKSPSKADRPMQVAVVGAGIVGASIAYHLARRGAAVTVVERARPAGEATGKSFAWINASDGNPKPYFRLRFQSMLEYRRLQAELDGALPLRWGGSLLWDGEEEDIERFVRRHRAWGYAIRSVDRAEFQRLEPGIADPPARAAFAEFEGSLEPVSATEALLAAAERLGARLLTGLEVAAVTLRGGRVRGLATGRGEIAADRVVLAAGTASAGLAAGAGVRLPLEGSPGLLVRTSAVGPVLNRVVLAPALHMRQDAGGRILVGETFGGGPVPDDPRVPARALVGRVRARLPGARGLEVEDVIVGVRPMPRDGFPIVGRAPGVRGLYLAVMHSGVTLAPAVGRFAAEEVLTGARVELLAPYRPERFARPRAAKARAGGLA